ncbi:MAG: aminoacyl-tRNA hydrolase [Proteobacteria bacterium]|nr:aminoacyl-tRNA hydrolase [Pseudomonadota bacterium]
MLLLVGLGNPGPEYARHRHNVGFMALERLAQVHRFAPWRRRFQGEVAEGRLDDDKCLLLKPLTYMNESGRAVGEAMRFFKLAPEDIVVFYDEIDLAPGKVRVKRGGGAAGHNGIRSMIAHVGGDFVRVRIGVGHPGHKDRVIGHVLHDFSGADRDWLDPVLDAMADAAPLLAEGADDKFQTRVAFLTQPPAPTKTASKES